MEEYREIILETLTREMLNKTMKLLKEALKTIKIVK